MGFLRSYFLKAPALLPRVHFPFSSPRTGNVFLRAFGTANSYVGPIKATVDEFIQAKKAELKEYQSTNPPDRAEIENLLSQLSRADVSDNTPFTSLGLDGLDEVELVLTIESKFGITLSEPDFHSIHSIADAVRVISDSIPNHSESAQ